MSEEYIGREAFIADMEKRYCEPCKAEGKDHSRTWCRACWVDDMLAEIEDAPAADVALVVHGEWWHLGGDEWCCTNCGNVIHTEGSWERPEKKYCDECGAKMMKEEANE
jgi:hypothetical protein